MAPPTSNKKSLFLLLGVSFFIITTTYLISFLARGYKIGFNQGSFVKATGLLSATSTPKSASVYINDRLTTATDDTINLPPGNYQIKIIKDGYLPWQKTALIKKEVVFQTAANLFHAAPDLKPLTLTGTINPILSLDNSKIIYSVASASASRDNGLYQLNLTSRPLPLNKNLPKQIHPNFPGINWANYNFEFSPDSRSILATGPNTSYLIELDTSPSGRALYDITPRLPIIRKEWQQQTAELIKNKIKDLPNQIIEVISTTSAQNVTFSSSDSKILYLAQKDNQLLDQYITPPPAQNDQNQTRQIKADHYYLYDQKDDTNFLIGHQDTVTNPFWLPNSNNIIYIEGNQIKTIEYDTTNSQTIFADNFDKKVVFPWPDGSRIITITSAYPGAQENLYAITIR